MKISLKYTNGVDFSSYSVAISMMCAEVPATLAAPTVIIQNLDQIVIEWQPPATDGGTPILGYKVDMSDDGFLTSTQIYDGSENPGARHIEVTEFNSAPLIVITYYFRVRAINWIGASIDSTPLVVILTTQTSEIESIVSGTGIATIEAFVISSVEVQARDSTPIDILTGGDIFSLQVSNE